jgi:mono/diheme cytochrome c family protein
MINFPQIKIRLKLTATALALSLILAACANNGDGGQAATERPTITPFPTFSGLTPTVPAVIATAAANNAAQSDVDPQLIERGRGRYEALECASCHGENGEGTDDGSPLVGLALSETEFTDFMRSGGEMGSDHQYSTDRLSASGGRNLYLYLVSLESDSE